MGFGPVIILVVVGAIVLLSLGENWRQQHIQFYRAFRLRHVCSSWADVQSDVAADEGSALTSDSHQLVANANSSGNTSVMKAATTYWTALNGGLPNPELAQNYAAIAQSLQTSMNQFYDSLYPQVQQLSGSGFKANEKVAVDILQQMAAAAGHGRVSPSALAEATSTLNSECS